MSTHGASIAELLNFSRDNKLGDSFVNIANSIEQMNIIYLKVTWAKFLIGPDNKINPDEKLTLEIINKAKEEIEQILKEGDKTWTGDPDAVRHFGHYQEELKKMCKIEEIFQTYISIHNDRI